MLHDSGHEASVLSLDPLGLAPPACARGAARVPPGKYVLDAELSCVCLSCSWYSVLSCTNTHATQQHKIVRTGSTITDLHLSSSASPTARPTLALACDGERALFFQPPQPQQTSSSSSSYLPLFLRRRKQRQPGGGGAGDATTLYNALLALASPAKAPGGALWALLAESPTLPGPSPSAHLLHAPQLLTPAPLPGASASVPDGHPFPLLALLCLSTLREEEGEGGDGAEAALYRRTLAHVVAVGEGAVRAGEEEEEGGLMTAEEEAGVKPGLWEREDGSEEEGGNGSVVERARALAAKLLPGLLPPPPPPPAPPTSGSSTTSGGNADGVGANGTSQDAVSSTTTTSTAASAARVVERLGAALGAGGEDMRILWALLEAGVDGGSGGGGGGATQVNKPAAATAASAFNFARLAAPAPSSSSSSSTQKKDPFKNAALLALRMRGALVGRLCGEGGAQSQAQTAKAQAAPSSLLGFADPFAAAGRGQVQQQQPPEQQPMYLPLCPEAVPLALLAPGNADIVAAALPTVRGLNLCVHVRDHR